jgi:endonuclease YncB( thermonuclease family)
MGSVAAAMLVVACSAPKGPPGLASGDVVRVVAIVKGDEIKVKKSGAELRVRLVGVHAFSPVLADPQVHALSAGAQSALEEWIKDKDVTVTLDHTPHDGAGRWLAYVDDHGADINRRLIETGWGVVYTEFPFDREATYLAAEASARASSKGVWDLKSAVDLIRGLRRQWLTVRPANGKTQLADALLQ